MTETGSIMGTAQYLSPEQAQGLAVTPRSDLYAIGVLLYEMLAGAPPFQADAPGILLRMQLISEPPPLPSTVPEAVRAVVSKMLAKPARDRFESAREARTALEQAVVPVRGTSRREIVFMPAITDADDEPPAAERPRRATQRGRASLADDGAHDEPPPPPPPSTSMSGRSATMLADFVPVDPVEPRVDPSPAGDAQSPKSGVFGTVRSLPSVADAPSPPSAVKTVLIVAAVLAVLAFVALAASGMLGVYVPDLAAISRGGDDDG
jgi:serine/threonine protein kinase